MSQVLILGAGNLLLSDDGAGVHVIRRLMEAVELPEQVQVLDGGTMGLDLLHYLEGIRYLLIIDAMETGGPPGTLRRLAGDEVPAYLSVKMSPHQIGLPDMLFAAKLRDLYPQEVVVWGVQPGSTEVGLELTPAVAAQVEPLVGHILEELARWGIEARRSPDAA
ncbi:MAG: HyaD/HybD family hydrogenase maturation endopeptidase [Anaerolineae bacterium]|jgi:hydrogenase maturation protease